MSGLSGVFAFMDDCFPGTRLTVKVGNTVLDKDSLRELEERPLENKAAAIRHSIICALRVATGRKRTLR